MMPLAALAAASCLAIGAGAGQIRAGDLAAASPGLTVPAPDISVALAPAPGVARVFHVAELLRLSVRYGWSGAPQADVCIERPVSVADPERFLAVMRQTMPHADIEILDYGRQPIPAGEIEFPPGGLHPGPAGALWSGFVRYADARRFSIWARVKVLIPVTRLIAVVDLQPGREIGADQVRAETLPEYPPVSPVLTSVEDAVGKWPRAAIHAGAAIRVAMLQNPQAVMRGDTVTVDVYDGAAHLELQAQAEGSGAVGETVAVINPYSHRRFPARVEGRGKVSVGSHAAKLTHEGEPMKVNP